MQGMPEPTTFRWRVMGAVDKDLRVRHVTLAELPGWVRELFEREDHAFTRIDWACKTDRGRQDHSVERF